MTDISYESLRVAVICVISGLILLLNSILLYKIIKAAGGILVIPTCMRGPRFQTLVSLIIGDIVVAFFPMIVKANIKTSDFYKKCKVWVLSDIYLRHMMSFVYGMGLVVLAVECMVYRRRTRAAASSLNPRRLSTPGAPVSFMVSAVPWIFGLVLVLPLSLADLHFDSDNCGLFSSSDLRFWILALVCQVFPAVVSVSFAIINKYSSKKYTLPAAIAAGQSPNEPPLSSETPSGVSSWPHQEPPISGHQNTNTIPLDERSPGGYEEHPNTISSHEYFHDQNQEPQNDILYGGEAENSNSFYRQSSEHNGPQDVFEFVSPSDELSLAPLSSNFDQNYSKRETCALLTSAIAFFVCVVPMAVLTVRNGVIYFSVYFDSAFQVINVVYLFFLMRPCLLPVLWITTGSLKKKDY